MAKTTVDLVGKTIVNAELTSADEQLTLTLDSGEKLVVNAGRYQLSVRLIDDYTNTASKL